MGRAKQEKIPRMAVPARAIWATIYPCIDNIPSPMTRGCILVSCTWLARAPRERVGSGDETRCILISALLEAPQHAVETFSPFETVVSAGRA